MVSVSPDLVDKTIDLQRQSVLVTGASGFIGRALVKHLCSLGYPVVVLSRQAHVAFPAGVRLIRGDLLEPSSLPLDLFCGVETIFHCAGEINDPLAMRRLHVNGTANLLDLVCQGVAGNSGRLIRLVQLSSVGAYGPSVRSGLQRIVTENSVENPHGEYEITKTEAGHLLLNASRVGKIVLTILRPSNVFGPGMPNRSLPGLISAIRRGLFFYIGSREAVCTYVHVDDVVRALVACAGSPVAAGKIYNLSNDCALSDLANSVADSCKRAGRLWLFPRRWFEHSLLSLRGVRFGHSPNQELMRSFRERGIQRTLCEANLVLNSPFLFL